VRDEGDIVIKTLPNETAIRAWVAEGGARLLYVHATGVVAEVGRRHGVQGEALQLAGELVIANLLLAAWVKGEERITLQARLSTPSVTFYGEADAQGVFRGRFKAAYVPPLAPPQRLAGDMLVIRYDASHEIYRGGTSFDRLTLEDALTTHLHQSEQVDAVARIVVTEDDAWGVMVERMPTEPGRPGIEGQEWRAWSTILSVMPASEIAENLADGELAGERVEVLEATPLVFTCRCSEAKVHEMLVSLGAEELDQMIVEDGGAEVTCHFCNTAIQVNADVLAALRDIARGQVAES